jgi:hypothetical protein
LIVAGRGRRASICVPTGREVSRIIWCFLECDYLGFAWDLVGESHGTSLVLSRFPELGLDEAITRRREDEEVRGGTSFLPETCISSLFRAARTLISGVTAS